MYIYISVCILYIEVVGDDGPISLVANSQLCDTPNPSTPQWRNSPPATVWLLQRSPQCGSVRCCHRRQSRIPGCSHSHLHRPCNPQWGQQRPDLWSSPWPRPREIKGITATTATAPQRQFLRKKWCSKHPVIRSTLYAGTKGMFEGDQRGHLFSVVWILKHRAAVFQIHKSLMLLSFEPSKFKCKSSSSSKIAHRDFPSTQPLFLCLQVRFLQFRPFNSSKLIPSIATPIPTSAPSIPIPTIHLLTVDRYPQKVMSLATLVSWSTRVDMTVTSCCCLGPAKQPFLLAKKLQTILVCCWWTNPSSHLNIFIQDCRY